MFSIQYCSVAAICVAGVCENHTSPVGRSQRALLLPKRMILKRQSVAICSVWWRTDRPPALWELLLGT
jgi:hypothetical protein